MTDFLPFSWQFLFTLRVFFSRNLLKGSPKKFFYWALNRGRTPIKLQHTLHNFFYVLACKFQDKHYDFPVHMFLVVIRIHICAIGAIYFQRGLFHF